LGVVSSGSGSVRVSERASVLLLPCGDKWSVGVTLLLHGDEQRAGVALLLHGDEQRTAVNRIEEGAAATSEGTRVC
jgi:hypothetical protein